MQAGARMTAGSRSTRPVSQAPACSRKRGADDERGIAGKGRGVHDPGQVRRRARRLAGATRPAMSPGTGPGVAPRIGPDGRMFTMFALAMGCFARLRRGEGICGRWRARREGAKGYRGVRAEAQRRGDAQCWSRAERSPDGPTLRAGPVEMGPRPESE